jgi:hypothetical protein
MADVFKRITFRKPVPDPADSGDDWTGLKLRAANGVARNPARYRHYAWPWGFDDPTHKDADDHHVVFGGTANATAFNHIGYYDTWGHGYIKVVLNSPPVWDSTYWLWSSMNQVGIQQTGVSELPAPFEDPIHPQYTVGVMLSTTIDVTNDERTTATYLATLLALEELESNEKGYKQGV